VVYTAADKSKEIAAEGILSGGSVLPGLKIKLANVFTFAAGKKPE
jgi:hypothetical protein